MVLNDNAADIYEKHLLSNDENWYDNCLNEFRESKNLRQENMTNSSKRRGFHNSEFEKLHPIIQGLWCLNYYL